jgi:hypothetical protein
VPTVILALQIASGMDKTGKMITLGADVNDDWKIGLSEAIFIMQKAVGLR